MMIAPQIICDLLVTNMVYNTKEQKAQDHRREAVFENIVRSPGTNMSTTNSGTTKAAVDMNSMIKTIKSGMAYTVSDISENMR